MSTRKTKKPSAGADALRMQEPLSRDDPAMQEILAEERSNAAVARQIYELRTARGLTQQQLAELIGTKQPVIARLEDADYEGHSLATLYRIGAALGASHVADVAFTDFTPDPYERLDPRRDLDAGPDGSKLQVLESPAERGKQGARREPSAAHASRAALARCIATPPKRMASRPCDRIPVVPEGA